MCATNIMQMRSVLPFVACAVVLSGAPTSFAADFSLSFPGACASSFQAMTVAAALLRNRPFTDALIDGDDSRVYGYGSAGRADFYAAWNVGKSWKDKAAPEEREVTLALPDGNWKLIDWQGRALPLVRAPGGQVRLKLSALPSYFVRIR